MTKALTRRAREPARHDVPLFSALSALALGGYAYCARELDERAALAVVPDLASLGFAGYLDAHFADANRGPLP